MNPYYQDDAVTSDGVPRQPIAQIADVDVERTSRQNLGLALDCLLDVRAGMESLEQVEEAISVLVWELRVLPKTEPSFVVPPADPKLAKPEKNR